MKNLPCPHSIYREYEDLVPAIARDIRRRCPATVELADLEQTGRAALWQACREFDAERAETFRSYVKMRIRGAILDSIRGAEFREASRERDAFRLDAFRRPQFERLSAHAGGDPFVERAVEQLGGQQAAVVALRYYVGLSRPETAARIGISRYAVGRAERAAMRTLRGLLRVA